MRLAAGIAGGLSLLLLAACKDDRIVSYRVEKRTSAPMAEPMMPSAGQALPPGHPTISGDTAGQQIPPGHRPISGDMAGQGLPPGHPPIGGMMGGDAGSAPGEVSWKLPRGWVEKPLTEMRLGSFRVPGKDGQEADISIVVLGGDAGGDLANVNRWRGQINLQPISEAELSRFVEKISPGGRRMLLVDIVTQELFIDNKYRERLVAAIYSRGGRTWFFKMTGEDALVRSVKPAFLRFLADVRFHDQPGG